MLACCYLLSFYQVSSFKSFSEPSQLPFSKHSAQEMAEVVVSPFLGVFYEKLSSLIVLRDVEAIQIRDVTTRDWLRRLKDAAYDADDILDE
ncbi:hypothetical protein IFM89_000980 [Coptis chinensis]|uniref:Disease resistance N-terminal domain-containing protein n=1 Tax=Coptis chinensis TaxID=261450 RepID=A0A835II63_9MAGN|nr:hypothetical protein IFM89_000980 [Coptis chinensis]